jgi:NAD(P)-dependent dehydrogenase (short-subunit alcohol dehydrogenase family)
MMSPSETVSQSSATPSTITRVAPTQFRSRAHPSGSTSVATKPSITNTTRRYAAIVALARGIAETLVGTKITCNSVLPGPTASEGVQTFVAQMAEQQRTTTEEMEREFFAHARPTSLLKRFEQPDEVAAMIVYICSERASGTNGSALRVDGGVVRAIL